MNTSEKEEENKEAIKQDHNGQEMSPIQKIEDTQSEVENFSIFTDDTEKGKVKKKIAYPERYEESLNKKAMKPGDMIKKKQITDTPKQGLTNATPKRKSKENKNENLSENDRLLNATPEKKHQENKNENIPESGKLKNAYKTSLTKNEESISLNNDARNQKSTDKKEHHQRIFDSTVNRKETQSEKKKTRKNMDDVLSQDVKQNLETTKFHENDESSHQEPSFINNLLDMTRITESCIADIKGNEKKLFKKESILGFIRSTHESIWSARRTDDHLFKKVVKITETAKCSQGKGIKLPNEVHNWYKNRIQEKWFHQFRLDKKDYRYMFEILEKEIEKEHITRNLLYELSQKTSHLEHIFEEHFGKEKKTMLEETKKTSKDSLKDKRISKSILDIKEKTLSNNADANMNTAPRDEIMREHKNELINDKYLTPKNKEQNASQENDNPQCTKDASIKKINNGLLSEIIDNVQKNHHLKGTEIVNDTQPQRDDVNDSKYSEQYHYKPSTFPVTCEEISHVELDKARLTISHLEEVENKMGIYNLYNYTPNYDTIKEYQAFLQLLEEEPTGNLACNLGIFLSIMKGYNSYQNKGILQMGEFEMFARTKMWEEITDKEKATLIKLKKEQKSYITNEYDKEINYKPPQSKKVSLIDRLYERMDWKSIKTLASEKFKIIVKDYQLNEKEMKNFRKTFQQNTLRIKTILNEVGYRSGEIEYCIWMIERLLQNEQKPKEKGKEYLAIEIRFDENRLEQHQDCYQEAVKRSIKSTLIRTMKENDLDIKLGMEELGELISLKNCKLRYIKIN